MMLTESDITQWVVVPLFIFFARIFDVSLDTMRIVNINRDNRAYAAILGFFQILIWLFAIQQIMQNLTNIFYYVVYAGGFASGTYIGLFIEDKWVKGMALIRVISDKDLNPLSEALHTKSFKSTQIESYILDKKSYILLIIINRKNLDNAVTIIEDQNPGVFYTIQDIKFANEERLKQLHHSEYRETSSSRKIISMIKKGIKKKLKIA